MPRRSAASDPQQRIGGLALGVGQTAPALGEQADDGAQLIGPRGRNQPRVPGIGEPLCQEAERAGPLKDIANQQQAGIAALVLAGFDHHGPVARWLKELYLFTHGVRPPLCIFGLDPLDYKQK